MNANLEFVEKRRKGGADPPRDLRSPARSREETNLAGDFKSAAYEREKRERERYRGIIKEIDYESFKIQGSYPVQTVLCTDPIKGLQIEYSSLFNPSDFYFCLLSRKIHSTSLSGKEKVNIYIYIYIYLLEI